MWSGYVVFMEHGSLGDNQKFWKGVLIKTTWKQVHLIWSWYTVFIKHDPTGDNQDCLKRNFEESHIKSGPSNMVLVCHTY